MGPRRLLQVFTILAVGAALNVGLQDREPERRRHGRGRRHQLCKKILAGDASAMKNVHTAHDRIRHNRMKVECRYHMQAEENCRKRYRPSNGAIHSFHDNFYGWVVNVICHRGYELKGRTSVLCYEDLAEDEYPRCQIKDCGHPSIRDNTTFIYNSTTYGSRLRVTCDEGFNLTGSAKSKCLASGSWSKIARCDRKRCPEIKNPAFGVLHKGKTADGIDTVVFECAPGYTLEGHFQSSCRYGTWTFPEPKCLQKTDKSEISYNARLVIVCTAGLVTLTAIVVFVIIMLSRRLTYRRKRTLSSQCYHVSEEKPSKSLNDAADLDICLTIDEKKTADIPPKRSKMHFYENRITQQEESVTYSTETTDKTYAHDTLQGAKHEETNFSGLETNDISIGDLVTNDIHTETVCKDMVFPIPKETASNVCLVTPLQAGDDCIGTTAENIYENDETGLDTVNRSQGNATEVIRTPSWNKLFFFLIPKVCTSNWKLFAINLLGARLPKEQNVDTTISRIENASKTRLGGEKLEVILYNVFCYWRHLNPSTGLEDIENALRWSSHYDVIADMKAELQNFYEYNDGSGQETSVKNPGLAGIPELEYRIDFQGRDMSVLPCFEQIGQDTDESHVITPVAQEELLTCDYRSTDRHGHFYRKGKQFYRIRRQYSYPPFRRLRYKFMYKLPRKNKIPQNKIKSKPKQDLHKTTMEVHPRRISFTEKDVMCVNLIQRLLQLDKNKILNEAEFLLFTKFMLCKIQQTSFVGTEQLYDISFEDFIDCETVMTSRNGTLCIIDLSNRKVILLEDESKMLHTYVERLRREVLSRVQDADQRFLFLTYDGKKVSKEYLNLGNSDTSMKSKTTECPGDGRLTSESCQPVSRQTTNIETSDAKTCEAKRAKAMGLKRKLPVSRSTSYANSLKEMPQQETDGHVQHRRRYFCKDQADTIRKVFRQEINQGSIKQSAIYTKFYECHQLREAFGVTPEEITKILVKKIADRVRCFIRNREKNKLAYN